LDNNFGDSDVFAIESYVGSIYVSERRVTVEYSPVLEVVRHRDYESHV